MTPRSLAWVFIGGALGTVSRYGVDELIASASWPWSTLAVNVLGAFLLGALVARWHDRDHPLRLVFGAGFLGAFTTYGALAVQSEELLRDQLWSGVGYAVLSVVAGLLAAFAGLMAGRPGPRSEQP